ncbi:MAG: selenide, water dikinase SelD [Pseudomonadota bacterium]
MPVREIVLLGGGHSHVQVLRALGMRPLRQARVTVISREPFTPYSGMLPGHVAGFYEWDDVHVDLAPLAAFAGARLIPDEVVGVDPENRRVALASHPTLTYDVLSINTGAAPECVDSAGIPVKPIGRFLPQWRRILASARSGDRVALVGGGAGGVELALAMRRRLPAGAAVILLTDVLLPGLHWRAARTLRQALLNAGVVVEEGFRVAGTAAQGAQYRVTAADGRTVSARHLLWVTGVAAPGWLTRSGLARDDAGFVRVDATLRSVSHPDVFAAGDVAALAGQPRPKAGVFAVREGPVLAANLRRTILGGKMRRYRAQRRFLTLIGTGDGRAVAARGAWSAQGRWVWHWKDRIDRRFMRRFKALPEMPAPRVEGPRALQADTPALMRCGGCGAKLGADPLRQVLSRLPDQGPLEQRNRVKLGIGDDAAVIQVDRGDLVMTVDGFRSLVEDAYLFGRITAHHALNDVLAMGGRGVAALAFATVPLMSEAMMSEELYQLLAGAVEVLNGHGVPLVGGHSAEGAELGLALSITGADPDAALLKGGLAAGDALVLTKPLGTGAVLAGHMRRRARSDWLAAATAAMDSSNAAAVEVLRHHGVRGLTDVTGFGLAGHLGEMLRASGCGGRLLLDGVPALPGARELVTVDVVSSLQVNNELALADFELVGVTAADPRVRLLADPQTSGGMLAGIPRAEAEGCVEALRAAGYAGAAMIGEVTTGPWQVVAS